MTMSLVVRVVDWGEVCVVGVCAVECVCDGGVCGGGRGTKATSQALINLLIDQ